MLLDACSPSRNKELRAAVIVALNTGLRRGELLGLIWDHIDASRGVIRLETTKSGRRREVPLNDDSYRALITLGQKPEGRVFRTAAKLEDVNVHTLRHTFASWAVMRGVSLKELQDLLGRAVSRLEGLAGPHPAEVSTQSSRMSPPDARGVRKPLIWWLPGLVSNQRPPD